MIMYVPKFDLRSYYVDGSFVWFCGMSPEVAISPYYIKKY